VRPLIDTVKANDAGGSRRRGRWWWLRDGRRTAELNRASRHIISTVIPCPCCTVWT